MTTLQDIGTDAAREAAKSAPPLAVASSFDIDSAVSRLTLLYVALQIFFLLHKHRVLSTAWKWARTQIQRLRK